jgi:hypothetical protein
VVTVPPPEGSSGRAGPRERRYATATAASVRSAAASRVGSPTRLAGPKPAEQDRGRRGRQHDVLVRQSGIAPRTGRGGWVRCGCSERSSAWMSRCRVHAMSAR